MDVGVVLSLAKAHASDVALDAVVVDGHAFWD